MISEVKIMTKEVRPFSEYCGNEFEPADQVVSVREKHEPDRVPLGEKYALTIKEAAVYFNIGNKKLRRLAEENLGRFAVESGNRYLIIRPKFEQFLDRSSSI